ncbi:MAG: hypothetical protein KIG63_06175 [Methanobrevibacter sp.]|nr:hypothetical protein [Methanobrevibacter sp.]
MPRPSNNKTESELIDSIGKVLVPALKNNSKDVASLTIKLNQLKLAKTELSQLIKLVEKERDLKIFEPVENKNKKIKLNLKEK